MMTAFWLRRAIYDEELKDYRVESPGDPTVHYTFMQIELDEDEADERFAIALHKSWIDEDEAEWGEVYPFEFLDPLEAIDQVIADLRAEAKTLSEQENLDEFLALIDIVKQRAIDADLDGEGVFLEEGLFQTGPEDAYSIRPFDPNRLHDHVERPDDECWRLGIARAVSTDDPAKMLGWVHYVIHYPDLDSSASEEDIAGAEQALLLDIDHMTDEAAAHLAQSSLSNFMTAGDRVLNPDNAYLNDTEVFEFISILSRNENDRCPTWQVFSGEALRAFQTNQVLRRSEWYARDFFAEFSHDSGMPLSYVEQFAAAMHDALGLKPEPFAEGSPFNDVEL